MQGPHFFAIVEYKQLTQEFKFLRIDRAGLFSINANKNQGDNNVNPVQ